MLRKLLRLRLIPRKQGKEETSGPGLVLPDDIMLEIAAYLDKSGSDVFRLAFACRRMYNLLTCYTYWSVCIPTVARWKVMYPFFMGRPQIASQVKILVLGSFGTVGKILSSPEGSVDAPRLVSLISCFGSLQHFVWRDGFANCPVEVWRVLQTHCPSLHEVELVTNATHEDFLGDFPTHPWTSLTGLSIHDSFSTVGLDVSIPQTFWNCLRQCSDVKPLLDCRFPCLRKLVLGYFPCLDAEGIRGDLQIQQFLNWHHDTLECLQIMKMPQRLISLVLCLPVLAELRTTMDFLPCFVFTHSIKRLKILQSPRMHRFDANELLVFLETTVEKGFFSLESLSVAAVDRPVFAQAIMPWLSRTGLHRLDSLEITFVQRRKKEDGIDWKEMLKLLSGQDRVRSLSLTWQLYRFPSEIPTLNLDKALSIYKVLPSLIRLDLQNNCEFIKADLSYTASFDVLLRTPSSRLLLAHEHNRAMLFPFPRSWRVLHYRHDIMQKT